jgi:hypothetical protein
MMESRIDNPWGHNEPIDLSKAPLSIVQKAWLGSQLASGLRSLDEPHSKYKIHKKTLGKYKRQTIKKLRIRLGKGRPPILDDEAKIAISTFAGTRSQYEEAELRQIICEKHQETWSRALMKYSIYDNKPYCAISSTSLIRYIEIFANTGGGAGECGNASTHNGAL